MASDIQSRNAVRALVERFEQMSAQHLSLAYVLAKKATYAQLLEEASETMATVIQPVITANVALSRMYVALDDPDAHWSAALMNMLKLRTDRYHVRGSLSCREGAE
jgi:hypothetical protein